MTPLINQSKFVKLRVPEFATYFADLMHNAITMGSHGDI
jgi:hypothetical protein